MLFDNIEEALDFLDYHQPTTEQKNAHEAVNYSFQTLLASIWDAVPAGPGKVVAIRSLNDARMKFNSAIANNGK